MLSDSPLAVYEKEALYYSKGRALKIDRITPHCLTSQATVQGIGEWLTDPNMNPKASCNYGIGCDGKIGLYVHEKDRSWCTSAPSNDMRAITIECASEGEDPYKMNGCVFNSLINLCTDICERNGKTKLLAFNTKSEMLAHDPAEDEMILTVHRWYANKACPGDWLFSRLKILASTVTARLRPKIYRIQLGAFENKQYAFDYLAEVQKTYPDAYMVVSEK